MKRSVLYVIFASYFVGLSALTIAVVFACFGATLLFSMTIGVVSVPFIGSAFILGNFVNPI
jgi:hypothetical protein